MAKYKTGKRNKTLIGILFVLVAILAIGMVTALFRVDTQIHTKTLTTSNYEVGALDDGSGKEVEDKNSIRSKDSYNVEGLEIKVDEDAEVTYEVFFFDEDGDFLNSSVNSFSSIPEGADTFRIVITPTDEVEIGFFDIGDYAGLLTVTYNK